MQGKIHLVAAAALLLNVPSYAHHSISGAYHTDQRQKIEGNVVEFEYRNPHAMIMVQSTDPKAGSGTYEVEWSSVHRLERAGITKDALKPGDHVILIGYPSRTPGDRGMHVTGIERPSDGWKWGKPVE